MSKKLFLMVVRREVRSRYYNYQKVIKFGPKESRSTYPPSFAPPYHTRLELQDGLFLRQSQQLIAKINLTCWIDSDSVAGLVRPHSTQDFSSAPHKEKVHLLNKFRFSCWPGPAQLDYIWSFSTSTSNIREKGAHLDNIQEKLGAVTETNPEIYTFVI